MSIQNFPKIPKIALRKSCDEPKHAKTSHKRRGLIMLRPGRDNEIAVLRLYLLLSRSRDEQLLTLLWSPSEATPIPACSGDATTDRFCPVTRAHARLAADPAVSAPPTIPGGFAFLEALTRPFAKVVKNIAKLEKSLGIRYRFSGD